MGGYPVMPSRVQQAALELRVASPYSFGLPMQVSSSIALDFRPWQAPRDGIRGGHLCWGAPKYGPQVAPDRYCCGWMSTALLDFGASYNFIALPQLKQFAPNSKDWQ